MNRFRMSWSQWWFLNEYYGCINVLCCECMLNWFVFTWSRIFVFLGFVTTITSGLKYNVVWKMMLVEMRFEWKALLYFLRAMCIFLCINLLKNYVACIIHAKSCMNPTILEYVSVLWMRMSARNMHDWFNHYLKIDVL